MLHNQKGLIKSKVVMLALLIVVLIGGLLYVTGVYPAPESILTVGSIGGAERAERYRNPDTGKIELDENEINMFFQSAEWQNISKDPELLAVFTNKDMMQFFSQVNDVKQFIGVYESLETEAKTNNVQNQEEFNAFMNTAFDSYMLPLNLPLEQGLFITNLQQNGQLEQLLKFYSSIGVYNLSENEKLEALLSFATFWSFRSSDIELLSSRDIDTFKTGFTSVILNSETGMNLVNLVNSNNFNTIFIKAVSENMDAFVAAFSVNQELLRFGINNTELQYSISQWINNTDISNIINSNIFARIVATNQDFRNLMEAI